MQSLSPLLSFSEPDRELSSQAAAWCPWNLVPWGLMSSGVCVRVWDWGKEDGSPVASQSMATSKYFTPLVGFGKLMTGHSKPLPRPCLQVPDPELTAYLT